MNQRIICAVALSAISTMSAPLAWADENVKVIAISAKRFDYTPSQIFLKAGQPVLLKLTSADRKHGFNIPSMKLRTDVVPGQVSEIRFTPKKAGEIDFFCDVFCGDGHEGMEGKITVTN